MDFVVDFFESVNNAFFINFPLKIYFSSSVGKKTLCIETVLTGITSENEQSNKQMLQMFEFKT